MSVGELLRAAAENLIKAGHDSRGASNAHRGSESGAFGRLTGAANRPLRIGILGETNSGKSSLANLLVGASILPAHAVKNTKLPTLLKYESAPLVTVLYENGERITLPAHGNIPQLLAGLYESGGRNWPNASENASRGAVERVEVGLPSQILRSVEILDFPGSGNAQHAFSREHTALHHLDAAIWTTVATQAWRASEQAQWLELPETIRSQGLLAVTYCDMIAGGQRDLNKLQARLATSAMPYFRGISFVDARNDVLARAGQAGETRGFTAMKAANYGSIADIKAFLGEWAQGTFEVDARTSVRGRRGGGMTRRNMLVGLSTGAAVAVVGGGIGIFYAVKTPGGLPRSFLNDEPIRTLAGHAGWIHSVAFSSDGRTLLSGSGDNVLKLWDTASGRELNSFAEFVDGIRSATFSPDGSTILCGGGGNTLFLLDAVTGKPLRTFNRHSDGIPTVAFSPDGRTALSGSWDKTLKLWDIAKGEELRTFIGHTGDVNSVAFSPDGRTVLSGSRDRTVRLWDITAGRMLRSFTGHADWVSAVVFSPDGRSVLSSSSDKTLRLWSVATGRELRAIPQQARDFSPVTFSPDGRTILSGGDTKLKLWEATTGRELGTFSGHAGGVTSVAISPDGRTAVSGSTDKTLKLWDMTRIVSVSA